MTLRRWIAGVVCLFTLAIWTRDHAFALGPRHPAPKRPHATAYVPRMQEYAVVVPADPHAAEHDDVPWVQQRPKAPAYPWGWFGARSYYQPSTHLRYYGEAFDYSVRRGY